MKIRVKEPLLDYEGKPFEQDGKPVTYQQIFYMVLNNMVAGENMTPEQKAKAFGLSLKLYTDVDEVELTVDEAAMIKERAGKLCLPLVYGRVCQVLDGAKE